MSDLDAPDSTMQLAAVPPGAEGLSPEKRALILTGAARVFAEDGYEGASMARIAQQAGVSKGTLYNYFAGKAELFAAHVEQECSSKLAQVFGHIEPDGDPARMLHGIGLRMLSLMVSPDGLSVYRVVVSEAAKFPELARTFYEAGPARSLVTLADWLAGQARAGRLCIDDPGFAAEQFFALCQTKIGLRCRLLLGGEPDPAEMERVVCGAVRMFLSRYAPRSDGRPHAAREEAA